MPFKMEYDFFVIGRNPAAVAVLSLAVVASCGVKSDAQTVHGTPPSVTSPGFGGTGNMPHGVPPSVTSLGFGAIRAGAPIQNHHHHHPPPSGGIYYFPYAYPYVVDGPPSDVDNGDEGYSGGAMVSERRGPGAPTAAPDSSRDTAMMADAAPAHLPLALPPAADSAPQPETVLVFKDGHEVEIANYAIVGSTLYDLSQERRWKIGLSELDLPATVRENDNRGLDFSLPTNAQAN